MPVVISSKGRYTGAAVVDKLNEEVTVVELGPFTDDWMVEGYIDVSQLEGGDELEIREYIALDGAGYELFLAGTVSGPASEPVVRLHTKTLLSGMKYKVTVVQTSGTPRSIPYYFIAEVMGQV